MGMYRDDLEAALARNAVLERRVADLERARRQAPNVVRQVPAVTPRSPRITVAPPATWLPLYHLLVHSYRHNVRSVRAKVPRWRHPRWTSTILAVDLLARPAAWLAACLDLVFTTVWFVLGLLWFLPALAISTTGFVLGSVALVPVLALTCVRRHEGVAPPIGVRWGDTTPGPDDPDHLLLMSLLGISALAMPVTMLLL
jgi:hypothetical protein